MITDFFEQFQLAAMMPEDIRYSSFLLFMEIQRELIDLEDEEYLQGIEKIHQAKKRCKNFSSYFCHSSKSIRDRKSTVTMWKK